MAQLAEIEAAGLRDAYARAAPEAGATPPKARPHDFGFSPMQGPAYPGPMQGPAYPGPMQGPAYPGPMQGPAYPGPMQGPAYPGPMQGPAYPGPMQGPAYPAPSTMAPNDVREAINRGIQTANAGAQQPQSGDPYARIYGADYKEIPTEAEMAAGAAQQANLPDWMRNQFGGVTQQPQPRRTRPILSAQQKADLDPAFGGLEPTPRYPRIAEDFTAPYPDQVPVTNATQARISAANREEQAARLAADQRVLESLAAGGGYSQSGAQISANAREAAAAGTTAPTTQGGPVSSEQRNALANERPDETEAEYNARAQEAYARQTMGQRFPEYWGAQPSLEAATPAGIPGTRPRARPEGEYPSSDPVVVQNSPPEDYDPGGLPVVPGDELETYVGAAPAPATASDAPMGSIANEFDPSFESSRKIPRGALALAGAVNPLFGLAGMGINAMGGIPLGDPNNPAERYVSSAQRRNGDSRRWRRGEDRDDRDDGGTPPLPDEAPSWWPPGVPWPPVAPAPGPVVPPYVPSPVPVAPSSYYFSHPDVSAAAAAGIAGVPGAPWQ